jgi:hypothetical protein
MRLSAPFCALALASLLAAARPAAAAASSPSAIPGGLSAAQTPQFILFTHDDALDRASLNLVHDVTKRHRNRNGCVVPAAFYVTKDGSDCEAVRSAAKAGDEIGEHTMTHGDLHTMSYGEKKAQITGSRLWLAKCLGKFSKDIVGHRSPFLSDDADVRKILSDEGYLYDSSIPEVYNSPSSPSASKRAWPYRLSGGIKQLYSCRWFSDINHCSANERYSKLFEIPMWLYQKGPDSPRTPDIMDPPNAFAVLKAELDNNMRGNKAPVGIWTHSITTGYLTSKTNREQVSKFLAYALAKPNVWVVTPRQLVQWVQDPVPASEVGAWLEKQTGFVCAGRAEAPPPPRRAPPPPRRSPPPLKVGPAAVVAAAATGAPAAAAPALPYLF